MELLVQPGKALVPEQRNTLRELAQPGAGDQRLAGRPAEGLPRALRSMEAVCGPGLVGRNRRASQGQAKPCPHLQEPGSGLPAWPVARPVFSWALAPACE